MNPALRVSQLSKSYRLDEKEKRGGRTLGETIMAMIGSPFQRIGKHFGGPRTAHPNGVESDTHWALKNISFDVKPGEICAVIGPNGAGKSTLFKVISRITRPTTGFVEVRGRLGSLLEVGTGFHPELTGRENVFLNGAILGMPRREVARKFDEIVSFAEIDQFIDMPVKRYSSGMHIRLAFAVAAHLEPDVLLLDEIMSVGDSEFQKKSSQRIEHLTRQGITTLIISHALADVSVVAKRCLYIHKGKLVFDGDMHEAIKLYRAQTDQDLRAAKRDKETKVSTAVANGAPEPSPPVVVTAAPPVKAVAAVVESTTTPVHRLNRCSITSVATENQVGNRVLAEGDDLYVILRYQGDLSNSPAVFQIEIWSNDNRLLSNAVARFECPSNSRVGGERSAACVFPALPLRAGTYQVRVVPTDSSPTSHTGDRVDGISEPSRCTFAVEAARGPRRQQVREVATAYDSGLIRVPFQWSLPEAGKGGSVNGATPPSAIRTAGVNGSHAGHSVVDPVVLSIDSDQKVSVAFEYPQEHESPVNIIVNSSESRKPSNSLDKTSPFPKVAVSPTTPVLTDSRREMVLREPNSVVGFLDYAMRISTGIDFYTQHKDIFDQRVYSFESERVDPVVIDAGSQFGMSTLFFKHEYPRARVTAFEPDPNLFRLLQENMTRNGLSDVTLINTGLGLKSETIAYSLDPITGHLWAGDKGEIIVQVRPLSTFIKEPVDFLRLNLNGQELAVLQELDASGTLKRIRTIAVVYKSVPATSQSLGSILNLLAKNDFRYLVHDFDSQTNIGSKPPFRLTAQTRWSCIVYASRETEGAVPIPPVDDAK
jgi:FkbM family methyltransferase